MDSFLKEYPTKVCVITLRASHQFLDVDSKHLLSKTGAGMVMERCTSDVVEYVVNT